MTSDRQRSDIDASVRMLDLVGVPSDLRTVCYPYGDYNTDTISILNEIGFKAAVTTRTAIADLRKDSRFELPRLDTNDLPKSAHASANEWLLKVSAE